MVELVRSKNKIPFDYYKEVISSYNFVGEFALVLRRMAESSQCGSNNHAGGCAILALGIWIQLKGGVAMLPGEAMNRAISKVAGKRYENVKIFFDILYIVISALICLLFLGRLQGVREGSIIAAVLVGSIIKVYNRIFDKVRSGK